MKKWICVGAVALIVLGLGAWGYFEAAKRAWIRINEYDIRTEGSLQVGDLAPDVELLTTERGETRRISELYAEKPLVLTFGSYT